MNKKVIAIDAMGGDYAPAEIVKGVASAVNKHDITILLVGDSDKINNEISQYNYKKENIQIIHADEVITGSDTPTEAIRNKKNSSMVVGLNLLKKGDAQGFISAGNTGALLIGATIIVGRIKGIERPAIGTVLPNKKNFTFLLDSGANADVKPSYLAQFAIMGSLYSENILNVKNPKVGLVNIGSEKGKGSELYKQSYKLFEEADINFIGNIEGNSIPLGAIDVAVCDGFVGNIILKNSEGLASALLSIIKTELTTGLKNKIAAALLKKAFINIKNKFDPSEYGGAPLLGLKSLVVKAHGNSNARAIENAIKQCVLFTENDIIGKIESKLSSQSS